jgi:hypothetical protein
MDGKFMNLFLNGSRNNVPETARSKMNIQEELYVIPDHYYQG